MLRVILAAAALLVAASAVSAAPTIINTKHDLSTPGQNQVCIFCHTPHNANGPMQPLWNKAAPDPAITFSYYTSGNLTSTPPVGRPSPISLACLTCHMSHPGGTTNSAHSILHGGAYTSPDALGTQPDACAKCHTDGTFSMPPTRFKLGPNLTNDHPISIAYPIAGTAKLKAASDGTAGWKSVRVRLYNGKLECTSCHEPHDPTYAPFLVRDNTGSALCLTCHDK